MIYNYKWYVYLDEAEDNEAKEKRKWGKERKLDKSEKGLFT